MNAMTTDGVFDIAPAWRAVTPELQQELVEFWIRHGALPDAEQAARRAQQVVCVARDGRGALVGVATAVLQVIPRLRQPTYYYRQFIAPEARGNGRALPLFLAASEILEAANRERPESLGVLMEVENKILERSFTDAVGERTRTVFIGYSPRGYQLRVRYFQGAKLFPPARRIAQA